MKYKKIIVQLDNSYLTPFDSDTLISYVFAHDFETLRDILPLFSEQASVPFILTHGFPQGFIPKPLFFSSKSKNIDVFNQVLSLQKQKKEIKKHPYIRLSKQDFCAYLDGEEVKTFPDPIYTISEGKNTVARFHSHETLPYMLKNVYYATLPMVVYVQVFNEGVFERFRTSMKKVFLAFGYGKGKSRGHGKIKDIQLQELTREESDFFDFRQELKAEGILYNLGHYRPTTSEIEQIDREHSYYTLSTKQAKTHESHVFKGALTFLQAGSYVKIGKKQEKSQILGSYYQSGNSFNFGYIC